MQKPRARGGKSQQRAPFLSRPIKIAENFSALASRSLSSAILKTMDQSGGPGGFDAQSAFADAVARARQVIMIIKH